ncbi:sigma-70 family RNA polymerase sigma factor [Acetobacter oeni]
MVGLLPELRAFSRFLSHDRVRADDLVQEAVMRALASRAQFDPSTNLKAWTFTILRNLFYEQGRRRKREQAVLEQYGSGTRMNASPDADSYQVSDLDSMLWQLSPLLREALMLVGAQEMSYDEAAVICGVAVGTMKARVSRARAALIAIRDCAVKDN